MRIVRCDVCGTDLDRSVRIQAAAVHDWCQSCFNYASAAVYKERATR